MNRRRLGLALGHSLAGSLLLLLPFQVLAYSRSTTSGTDLTPIRWDLDNNGTVLPNIQQGRILYHLDGVGSADITDGSDLQAVENAFQTWSGISGSTLSFQRGPDRRVSTTTADGDFPVFWVESGTIIDQGTADTADDINIAGALAMTFIYRRATGPEKGEIIDANIVLNGAEASWTTTPDLQPSRFDIETVALHEIGHALGLGHSPVASAAMFPRIGPGERRLRRLMADDTAGLLATYPGANTASNRGSVRGILRSAQPIFGGLVWALDSRGRLAASAITAPDGSYSIAGLKPDNYTLHAQPANSQASFFLFGAQNLGSFYNGLQTNFLPTQAIPVQVQRGRTVEQDLSVASGWPQVEIRLIGRNGKWSNVSTHVRRGEQGVSLGVAGPGLPGQGTPLSLSGSGFKITGTTFGRVAGLPSVSISVTLSKDADLGVRDLILQTDNGVWRAIGGVEVTFPDHAGLPDEVGDGGPGTTPFSLELVGPGLDFTWERANGATWYRLYGGTLQDLHHGVFGLNPVTAGCHISGPDASVRLAASDPSLTYYLVTGVNGQGEGSEGQDSQTLERPGPLTACP